jgi:uncharacterized protein YndB with AHSA1/START domain
MQFQPASRIATFVLGLAAAPALAAVASVTPQSFVINHRAEVNATPSAVYAALGQIPQWWNPAHTYSGKSENLSLDMRAGGCWCETWDGGSIEHAGVLYAGRDKMLRLEGGFGPLQDLAVTAVLTFSIATVEGKTVLTMNYRVRGPDANLDKLAPIVDKVVGEGFERLVALAARS